MTNGIENNLLEILERFNTTIIKNADDIGKEEYDTLSDLSSMIREILTNERHPECAEHFFVLFVGPADRVEIIGPLTKEAALEKIQNIENPRVISTYSRLYEHQLKTMLSLTEKGRKGMAEEN